LDPPDYFFSEIGTSIDGNINGPKPDIVSSAVIFPKKQAERHLENLLRRVEKNRQRALARARGEGPINPFKRD
jgi:hypothetical protein